MAEGSVDRARIAIIAIGKLLSDAAAPAIPAELAEDGEFCELYGRVLALRSILSQFAKGDLSQNIELRGFMAGSLKALQAHLRHLTWQVQQVEMGDLSQRVDFLGDFSASFNRMVIKLDATLSTLRQKEEELTTLTNTLQHEVELRSLALKALQTSEAQFKYLAEHDTLTGALNRRSFMELAKSELQTAMLAGTPCCVALLDVDHFKRFNDTYGHLEGDVALRHVAEMARVSLRHTDIMGRYGGEEFVFLFPGADLDNGILAAERIRLAIAGHPVVLGGQEVMITASLGVTVITQSTHSEFESDLLPHAIRAADVAMYSAKKEGRNQVRTANIEKTELCLL